MLVFSFSFLCGRILGYLASYHLLLLFSFPYNFEYSLSVAQDHGKNQHLVLHWELPSTFLAEAWSRRLIFDQWNAKFGAGRAFISLFFLGDWFTQRTAVYFIMFGQTGFLFSILWCSQTDWPSSTRRFSHINLVVNQMWK